MIKTTPVVAIFWVVLVVGISVEKCKGENDQSPLNQISSEKHTGGLNAEDKEARYKEARQKAEAGLKEVREIWASLSPEEQQKVEGALQEAKEKAMKDKANANWINTVETTLTEAKKEVEAKPAAVNPH